MRLRVISDLHIDVNADHPLEVDADDCDVVVMAGDLREKLSKRVIPWLAENVRARGVPVVYVPGNHDFYGCRIPAEIDKARDAAATYDIHMLAEGESSVIGGVRFVGATLWTDYDIGGRTHEAMVAAAARVGGMNDHREIRYDDGRLPFLPRHASEAHIAQRDRIEMILATPFEGPTVVVTHHAPSPKSLQHGEVRELGDASYASDLEWMMRQYAPDLWIHGHVHKSRDYQVGSTRVIANPRGYVLQKNRGPLARSEGENPAFDPSLTVEVGPAMAPSPR